MLAARALTSRLLPLLLAACLLSLAGLVLATGARGEVFGGTGRIGSGVIKPGTGGAHGQVSPFTEHNFAVNPKTGAFFVVDEFEESGKNKARIQAFGPKGEFVAENRIALGSGASPGGLAVDPEKNKLYLLVKLTRPEESEAIEKQIEAKETAAANKEALAEKREKEGKTKEAEELRAEVKKLREEVAKLEEELPVFDPGLKAAGEIWSFSTEASTEKLKEQKVLASREALDPFSETAKVPLLATSGIAVDPKTHDIVIAGQQDESPRKGPGEEDLRAAIQRVHEKGELGPRYVDQGNCLDQGEPSSQEPACAAKPRAEFPRSPIVTPQGKVYVEVTQAAGEIWEVPTAAESGGGFKEVAVQPKRVFTLTTPSEAQKLLSFTGEEEVANTMSFAETAKGEGRIYVDGSVEGEPGLIALNWVEKGEDAEVTERGWSGGQNKASKQEKCVIPPPNVTVLVGAVGETALLFDSKRELESEPAVEAVLGFGNGGEACGHVEVTPPHVELGEQKEAKEVPIDTATKLTSQVVGANAKRTKWKFHYISGGTPGDEPDAESGYQFQTTSLSHEFLHVGEYEITEEVETDNLGSGVVSKKLIGKLITTAGKPKVAIVAPGSARVGEPAKFEAKVTDENEPTPHLKYTWNYGDGSAPVKEEETAAGSTATRKVEHTFVKSCPGKCTVVLEVADGSGSKGSAKTEVSVAISKAEEEQIARERAEREAREAQEAKERAEREAAEHSGSPGGGSGSTSGVSSTPPPGGGGVLPQVEVHDPEARVAGTSLSVSPNGSLTLKISCPAGEATCTGTVTLKTLGAVSAKAKKAVLTLASGSFTVAGGQIRAVTLHLSSRARSLLKRTHSLRALATVVAHDAADVTRTTKSTVQLRLLKRGKH